MKICFLTNELSSKNGWGRYSISLIDQIIKKGINCQVLVSVGAQDNELSWIEVYQVLPPLFTKRINKLFYLIKNYLRIRKLIQNSDIVHSLIEPYGPIAYLALKNQPLFITLHGTYAVDALNKWYLKKIYSWVYKKARQIFCVSKFTQQKFLDNLPVQNTSVINNGIDYEKFQKFGDLGKSQEFNKTIISVGALTARKGYHISIPAVAKVKRKYSNLKYYLIGNQEDKHYFYQLQNLVKKYNLENNIIFLEKISDDDLIKFYHQADLFLLTPVNIGQKFEGFGLVYLEANACGRPVVGSYGCGAEDAIKDGFNGLLVPQSDIKKTSQAILKILDSPVLSQMLGRNGRQRAREMNWSNIVNQYIQVYETVFKK